MEKWTAIFPEPERKRIVKAAKTSLNKPEGKDALTYLLDRRKLRKEIVDKFDLGYCPPFIEHQLKGRIITPIYDCYNELVAISSRFMDKNADLRFWHESFDKGSYLYGLQHAKDCILRTRKVIVVEGEFDVLYFHSKNFFNTVGVSGKGYTLSQAALLSRYCSEVYIMFDGDNAGKQAIERVLKLYKDNCMSVYDIKYIPVYIPDKKDPDDFLEENGIKELKNLLIESKKEFELIM